MIAEFGLRNTINAPRAIMQFASSILPGPPLGPQAGSGCAFLHTGEHFITPSEPMWFNGELNFWRQKMRV
jgi:hypothetical protein